MKSVTQQIQYDILQVEVYAILACINCLHTQYQAASIAIYLDIQDAQKALNSVKTTSKLIAKTTMELTRLTLFNSVRLSWVSGRFNVSSSEIADKLTSQAVYEGFIIVNQKQV